MIRGHFLKTVSYLPHVPVSEIAIVSMVSMLFHGISVELYGIQVECHGTPWTLCYFHGILWHPGGMPWNSTECHGRYVISMELQCNSMASRWNAMEFHGIQKIGTLTKLVSGSKQWKYMEFDQQNGCQQ